MRDIRRAAMFVFCAGMWAQVGWAQPVSARLRPVQAGDQTISGFVLPEPAAATGYVVEVYDISNGAHRFVDRRTVDRFERDGGFAVQLAAPVRSNQRIELTRSGQDVPGGQIDVVAAPPPSPPTAQLRPVQAGDQAVSGIIAPVPASAAGYFVETADVSGGQRRFLARRPVPSFDAAGVFTVQLDAPLEPDQRVEVGRIGGSAPLATQTVPTPTPPTVRLGPVHPGDQNVAGLFTPAPRSAEGFSVEITTADGMFVERRALDRIDAATGVFTAALGSPMRTHHKVTIVGHGVSSPPVDSGTFDVMPFLRPTLLDGTRIVHGYVETRAGVASVRVRVQRSALENIERRKQYLQMKSTADIDSGGQFAVSLDEPLVAGEIVVAEAFTAAQEPSTRESKPVTVMDPGSWGRARAYFAGGVVFSKDRDDFSKQDLSLAFVIDKGWLQKPDFRLGLDEGAIPANVAEELATIDRSLHDCLASNSQEKARCEPRLKAQRDTLRRPYEADGRMSFRQLNTFFDARLTALPIRAPAAASAPTASPASDTAAPAPAETQKFLDSRKGAVLQIGAYAPFYGPQTSWLHEGSVNALFVAPVFRFGIQTIPGDANGMPTVNANGEPDDVYHFWGFGFGLGHQKLSGTTNQTPEVISYLHVVWGKSEAFQYKKAPTDTTVVDNVRTMVEARLKIPSTAFQIGFDANLGDGHDDLRFVFGTRFDIGELFGRLKAFQP